MKFCEDDFSINAAYDKNLRHKLSTFAEETKCRSSLHLTLVTTYGLKFNEYAGRVQSVVTMDDLFKWQIQFFSASSFEGRWKYLRWLMKVFTIVSAAIFVLLCPIIRLAVFREQPMGEPKIANWQNINSQLVKRKQPTSAWVASRLFYWNSYRKLLYFVFV